MADHLLDAGFSEDDVHQMAVTNTIKLIKIDETQNGSNA
jgi:hypothetical protein